MKKGKKDIYKVIANIIRILIAIITIFLIFKKEYKNIGILILTMILTFYDVFVEKILKIKLENNLKISIILFIFSAQCLGTALGFYGKFLWWDTMLHTLSGVIFFFVGETVIKQLNNTLADSNINKKTIIAFGVCFSLATGVAQCLGTALGFYGKFLWWDTMLHTLSGVIFFFVGETVIKQLNNTLADSNINKKTIIAFGVCFSLATGVVWELFEFFVDTFLGQNMQVAKGFVGQDAIKDTMIDLISVTLGTVGIVIIQKIKELIGGKNEKTKNI